MNIVFLGNSAKLLHVNNILVKIEQKYNNFMYIELIIFTTQSRVEG